MLFLLKLHILPPRLLRAVDMCIFAFPKRNVIMSNTSASTSQRLSSEFVANHILPITGILNTRDLGGYTRPDGMMVKPGLLIRGASLATAKDSDLAVLSDLHVVKVIDFRSSFEKKGMETRILPGAVYIDLPIQPVNNEEASSLTAKHKSFNLSKLIMIAAFNDKAKTFAREMYPLMVMRPECQQQFAKFLREVTETTDGAVFFHCTQGKDRTGLAAAFLLSALGVDRESVIADFDKTNEVYARDVRKYCCRVKFFGGKEEELAVVKAFIGANTENFIHALDLINSEHGSMDTYLRNVLGLTDADFEILRGRYLNSMKMHFDE
jgi:Protein tyrosine/serine phosphatase